MSRMLAPRTRIRHVTIDSDTVLNSLQFFKVSWWNIVFFEMTKYMATASSGQWFSLLGLVLCPLPETTQCDLWMVSLWRRQEGHCISSWKSMIFTLEMKVQSPEKQRRKTKSFGKDPKYLLYKYNLIYIYNDYILYIHTLYISIRTSSVFSNSPCAKLILWTPGSRILPIRFGADDMGETVQDVMLFWNLKDYGITWYYSESMD